MLLKLDARYKRALRAPQISHRHTSPCRHFTLLPTHAHNRCNWRLFVVTYCDFWEILICFSGAFSRHVRERCCGIHAAGRAARGHRGLLSRTREKDWCPAAASGQEGESEGAGWRWAARAWAQACTGGATGAAVWRWTRDNDQTSHASNFR